MQIELECVCASADELAQLEGFLRQDPRLDDVLLQRGHPIVRPGTLGALEVLEFVATDVGLGVIAGALYDFIKARWRSGQGDQRTHIVLTRTDLPEGRRRVEIHASGSAEDLRQIVKDALSD